MAVRLETMEEKAVERRFILAFSPFTPNDGVSTSLVKTVNGSASSTLNTSYTTISNTGTLFAAPPAGPLAPRPSKPAEGPKYSRSVLRKLEQLASEPLDENAPTSEKEFMDWLHRD